MLLFMLLVNIWPSSCGGACANNFSNVNVMLTGTVSDITFDLHTTVFSFSLPLAKAGNQTYRSARPHPEFSPESGGQLKSAVDSCTEDLTNELKLTWESCHRVSAYDAHISSATVNVRHSLVTLMARVERS